MQLNTGKISMKLWPLIITLFLIGCGASAPTKKNFSVSKENQGEFRSAGAVIGFQELCLKQLSTTEGYKSWSEANSKNIIKKSKYKKSPSDKAYKIGDQLTSFVLVKHASLGCSVFAKNIDGLAAHKYLQTVFLEAKNGNPGSRIKVNTLSNGKVATNGIVLISESGNALLDVIISINTESDNSLSLALTGAVAGGI